MKRCPQCDFIYEDDQSLCDMDGVLLVLDARNLPASGAAEKAQAKRNRAVPAFATLILALVLGLVYYVSIHQRTAQNAYTPASAAEPPTGVNPTPESQPSQEAHVPATLEEAKVEEPKQPPTSPVKKQPVRANAANKTVPEPKKEDSKVGSILKKTGHILKKPFKL